MDTQRPRPPDRPKTLEEPSKDGLVRFRYDATWTPTKQRLYELQLIEAANLLDQKSLDKWPNLKKVWDGQSPEESL